MHSRKRERSVVEAWRRHSPGGSSRGAILQALAAREISPARAGPSGAAAWGSLACFGVQNEFDMHDPEALRLFRLPHLRRRSKVPSAAVVPHIHTTHTPPPPSAPPPTFPPPISRAAAIATAATTVKQPSPPPLPRVRSHPGSPEIDRNHLRSLPQVIEIVCSDDVVVALTLQPPARAQLFLYLSKRSRLRLYPATRR